MNKMKGGYKYMVNWNLLYVTNKNWQDSPEMYTTSYFKILIKSLLFLNNLIALDIEKLGKNMRI